MEWFFLVIASLGEILGVACINLFLKRKSLLWLGAVVVTFGFGFLFLSLAMESIPMGTAYAIWTGIGATGAVLAGILFFKEPASILRLLFLTCIVTGAVGLKMLS